MYSAQYKLYEPISLPKPQVSATMKMVCLPIVAICCMQTNAASTPHNINHANVAAFTFSAFNPNNTLSVSHVASERVCWLNKLGQFMSQLNKNGWAGYESVPIEKDSYLNACKLVMHTPDAILALWDIFPSPNGTISLEFKNKEIAAMSIGNKEFSYVAISKDKNTIKDKRAFDASEASHALIAMSELFGYKS